MKLSPKTIAIMKNFAQINTNMLLAEGNTLSTKAAKKTVAASVTVDDTFPLEFGIYDLNEFLGAMSLFESPILEFEEKLVTITEENNSQYKIKYHKAEKGVLVYQEKPITFPETFIEFVMPAVMLANIQKSAGILRAETVSFIGDGSKLIAQVGQSKVEANSYQVALGETDKTFRCDILIEHFKMMPGEYTVSISSRKISQFQATNSDLVYFLAVEATSEFN